MKIFGITIETKKELRNQIKELEACVVEKNNAISAVEKEYAATATLLNDMNNKYPISIGQTVYDVQLRNEKGRFTKTKASREHSLINEVVVDKKNYFNIVERINSKDVFIDRNDAEARLAAVCIK